MRTREPALFWRENMIASVIILRVLARMSYWRKLVIKCSKFNHFAIKLGLTSFNNNNRASLVKKVRWSFPGCLSFFVTTSTSKLKVSIVLLTTRNTLALSSSSCKLRIGSNLQLSCTWHSGPEIHNYSIRLFHRPYTETFSPSPIYCFLGCHSLFFEDLI